MVAHLARHIEVVVVGVTASIAHQVDVIFRGEATGAAQGVAQGWN